MFADETIATLPPGARLRIGTSSFEQPELNVPSTPITFVVAAYARAFDEHTAGS